MLTRDIFCQNITLIFYSQTMKTFALVAVLCLALASAYPYDYNNYNNYNSRYMGMGQYYNNPYQYGGMSGYNMMGRGKLSIFSLWPSRQSLD